MSLKKRLLIVENEYLQSIALKEKLKGDFIVFLTESVREALEVLENIEMDVIISDFELSGVMGIEFFSKIRERYPQIRVIVCSFSEKPGWKEQLKEIGVTETFFKPLNTDDLQTALLCGKKEENTGAAG